MVLMLAEMRKGMWPNHLTEYPIGLTRVMYD